MTKLLQEYKESFAPFKAAAAFLLGIIAVLMFGVTAPDSTTAVTVDRVIERRIVINKPIYLSRYQKKQLQCLTDNAYYEAGNQAFKGKIAVTNVVMNRVADKRFPQSPCAVVYQKWRGMCQFSWTCIKNRRIQSVKQYADARKAAIQVYLHNVSDITNGAKFYHANYVNPRWPYHKVKTIGDHIFYRG